MMMIKKKDQKKFKKNSKLKFHKKVPKLIDFFQLTKKMGESNQDNFGNKNTDIQNLLNFLSTCKNDPINLDSFNATVHDFAESGRGMQARKDLNKEDTLISIPAKYTP
jgi:hypothetical protein